MEIYNFFDRGLGEEDPSSTTTLQTSLLYQNTLLVNKYIILLVDISTISKLEGRATKQMEGSGGGGDSVLKGEIFRVEGGDIQC